jgi:hypothetical protein
MIMSNSKQETSPKFSIAGFIGAALGTIWWFVWQAIKGIAIAIVMLLYKEK